jgi:hypothetical protein
MKRVFAALLCLAVPAVLFLNAWEGFRYGTTADRVRDLERSQQELLDANRDVIGRIAYETSPDHVAEKAAAAGLAAPADSAVTRVQAEGAAAQGGGR